MNDPEAHYLWHAFRRVTVRTNIDRVVGGSSEETVIARVGDNDGAKLQVPG